MKTQGSLINIGWNTGRAAYTVHQIGDEGRIDVIYDGKPAYSGTCMKLYPKKVLNKRALILAGAIISVFDIKPGDTCDDGA